ncbi:redoxin domain-containing protein [Tenacibaculum tangerinum]|uniref:Redoxin domain-containing protein n=1 Tax=Tenacibaculum tangerinum TaxID=3038772 RepID=A0ABY8L1U8_9FLAO|nr:redoxin domain-containing protein [Tenacibaculum tangerinum]WGH75076.1 redoxin domain-containing protein [Tenacibaculum tangerinum]
MINNIITSIKVTDFHQNEVDILTKYANKILLLLFYNNACLGCTGRAIPLAYQFKQTYQDIEVIGIHSNFNSNTVSKEDILSIFTVNELPFPIYIDNDHKMYDFFQSEGTPQWVLLTPKGEVYRSIFGSQENAQNRLYYALESLTQNNG